MALTEWINSDKWVALKTKWNAVITLLKGGYTGQVLVSNGGSGDPSWQDLILDSLAIQGDDTIKFLVKRVSLPAWNMRDTDYIEVDLELDTDEQLLDWKIQIIDDSLSTIKQLEGASIWKEADGWIQYDPSTKQMTLTRTNSRLFDSSDYNSVDFSRGFIVVYYEKTI